MDIYQAIQARCTIREFAVQPLAAALVEKLITAGFAAPSNTCASHWPTQPPSLAKAWRSDSMGSANNVSPRCEHH